MTKSAKYLGLTGLYLFVISVPYSVALSEIGFWLGAVSVIFIIIAKKHLILAPRIFNAAFALFFVSLLITIPFSMDVRLSVGKAGILRWLFFPYLIINLNLEQKDIKNLLKALLVSSGLFSIFLIIQHLFGKTLLPFSFNVFQTVNQYNHNSSDRILLRLGQYYAMLFVFLIVYTCSLKDFKHSLAVFPSVVLSLLTTYFSYGRDAVIGIWGSLFIWGIIRWKYMLYTMILIAMAGVLFVFAFPHSQPARLFYSTIHITSAAGERYGSNMARMNMLDNAVTILKQHPLVGIGFNCYGEWTKKYDPSQVWERISFDPVESLVTTGFIGFMGFVVLYLSIFLMLFKFKDPVSSATLAMFLVFSISGSLETMFFNTLLQLRIMMFFIGIALSQQDHALEKPRVDIKKVPTGTF